MKRMSSEERLQLADEIRQLVEAKFPESEFVGQEDAVLIALLAMSEAGKASRLLLG